MHYLVASYLGHKPPPAASVHASAQVTDADELMVELGNVPIRQAAPIDSAAFDAAMKENAHGRQ